MLPAIRKRRSHRAYQDKPVEKEKLDEILFAAMCSPSAYHKNPWEFVIVKKQETKELLSEATDYAGFAKNAPLIIAIIADENNAFRWIEDCSIAAAHIYLEATNQKLGTCMIQITGMETPDGNDSEEYVRKVLNIPNSHRVHCLMPIGYPAGNIPEHSEAKFVREKVYEESR